MSTDDNAPILVWIRRDLRLGDNPALKAAADSGAPLIPVFIRDALFDAQGAAPTWRFGLGLDRFAEALTARGSELVLRRGEAEAQLRQLVQDTGARAVYWNRAYDAAAMARDKGVEDSLRTAGVEARSFPGNLIWEPWQVETKQGGPYKVYSPFWRAVAQREAAAPQAAPAKLTAPTHWPDSEALADWQLARAMDRGAAVVRPHLLLGEAAAQARLDQFLQEDIELYAEARDVPAQPATSGLSEPLSYGEISPRQIWHASLVQSDSRSAEVFRKELVWREFAYHLLYHFPRMPERCWREDWEAFPWQGDADHPHLRAWQQGRTGIEIVDAGQRELFVTGRMHNRVRMITASYLTKHLMLDWRLGQRWFADCLVDWDEASNAMGWQWVAGCGPDAAPYFRVFNPDTQARKFDPQGDYRDRWLVERGAASDCAKSFFDASPRAWGLDQQAGYPDPIVELAEGRERALAAYEGRAF